MGSDVPRKILLVDDDDLIREVLSTTLETEDVKLLQAASGEHALTIVDRCHPDLVILDIRMDGLDGISVCDKIKSDPRTATIKVIILTAFSDRAMQKRCEEVGADAFFAKPYSPLELIETISHLMPT